MSLGDVVRRENAIEGGETHVGIVAEARRLFAAASVIGTCLDWARCEASSSLSSLLLAAVGLLAAGCLDGKQETAAPDKVVGTLPTTTTTGGNANLPALNLKGDATAGKSVFASAGCTACHTLKDAGATGTVGPNLDDAKPSFELVVERVTLGKGVMPSFKGKLKDQQIADVAQYVSTVAGS